MIDDDAAEQRRDRCRQPLPPMACPRPQPCHAHWSTALHRKGLEALHPSGLSGVSGEPCRIWRIDIAECHRFRHAPDAIRSRSPAYDSATFRPPAISSRRCPFMSDSSRSRGLIRAHPRHRNNNRRSYRAVDETAEAAPVDARCAGARRARSRAARRRSSSRHNRAAWHTIDRSAAGPTSDHTRRMNLRLCHCHAAPCCCHARKGSVSSL